MNNMNPWRLTRKVGSALAVGLLLALLAGCGAAELASGLTEGEAQEAVVVLQQYGLNPTKVKVGEGKDATWLIQVPASQTSSANQILQQFELPREKPRGLGEVFSQTGLIPTATEEKAMYLVAMQGEIAHTLQMVDGVVSARVHIVLPEKNPLAENPEQKASASVFVKYWGDHLPLTQEEVKQIVSHSVDGLSENEVAVVMKPIVLDATRLRAMAKPTLASYVTGENTTVVVMVLAVLCLILAIALVVMVLRVQKEKQQVLQLRQQVGR